MGHGRSREIQINHKIVLQRSKCDNPRLQHHRRKQLQRNGTLVDGVSYVHKGSCPVEVFEYRKTC